MSHLQLADLDPHTHTWRRVQSWHGVGAVETEPAVVQVGGLILRDEQPMKEK